MVVEYPDITQTGKGVISVSVQGVDGNMFIVEIFGGREPKSVQYIIFTNTSDSFAIPIGGELVTWGVFKRFILTRPGTAWPRRLR